MDPLTKRIRSLYLAHSDNSLWSKDEHREEVKKLINSCTYEPGKDKFNRGSDDEVQDEDESDEETTSDEEDIFDDEDESDEEDESDQQDELDDEYGSDEDEQKLGKKLLEAVKEGDKKLTQRLLENSANAELPDNKEDGQTAIHLAARLGDIDIVQLLLEHSVDIDYSDNNGRSAMHLAAENGCEKVVKLLLEHKAKTDAEDKYGETAKSLAEKSGHKGIVRLLRKQARLEKALSRRKTTN